MKYEDKNFRRILQKNSRYLQQTLTLECYSTNGTWIEIKRSKVTYFHGTFITQILWKYSRENAIQMCSQV